MRRASCWVRRLMLYGYLILVNMPMMSGEANAMPKRIAAHPHAASPRFRECLEDDEVGIFVKDAYKRRLAGEVDVGFVDDDNALKRL